MKLSMGESEFFSSVKSGDVSAVRLALRPEPYLVCFQDENGRTPLWISVEGGLAEMTRTLIAHGAALDATDEHGNNLLHAAANGCLRLHGAIKDAFIDVVNVLLASGMDIDATNTMGASCLHHASAAGNKQIVLFLIERGASVNLKDNEGWTPLHWALRSNIWQRDIPRYLETLRVLADSGADLSAATYAGKSVLDVALEWNAGRPELIEFLKQRGAL